MYQVDDADDVDDDDVVGVLLMMFMLWRFNITRQDMVSINSHYSICGWHKNVWHLFFLVEKKLKQKD